MDNQLQSAKAALRTQTFDRLSQLTVVERAAASRGVCDGIVQMARWTSSNSVLFFAPQPEELDIWPLVESGIAAGKTVALPRYVKSSRSYTAAVVRDLHSDLRRGHFGVREPNPICEEIPLNRLDLVLVPGVAFDLHGRRLGRGKGYYDRLLADVCGLKCGVAFDEQIVDEVPVGPQDVPLNCILTPTRWLLCEPARGA